MHMIYVYALKELKRKMTVKIEHERMLECLLGVTYRALRREHDTLPTILSVLHACDTESFTATPCHFPLHASEASTSC